MEYKINWSNCYTEDYNTLNNHMFGKYCNYIGTFNMLLEINVIINYYGLTN